jgi:GTP pyrophosphokinase
MILTDECWDKIAKIISAPYLKLATYLISVGRNSSGNQFRHQCDTRAILIDYGHIDSVLLKAALTHDLIEDIPGFDHNLLINADFEGRQVYDLVMEVSKRPGENKSDFLDRILKHGSRNSRLLKCADRISNMHDLGFISNLAFIERYCDETERFILPMAEVDPDMITELTDLIKSRREMLEMSRRNQAMSR